MLGLVALALRRRDIECEMAIYKLGEEAEILPPVVVAAILAIDMPVFVNMIIRTISSSRDRALTADFKDGGAELVGDWGGPTTPETNGSQTGEDSRRIGAAAGIVPPRRRCLITAGPLHDQVYGGGCPARYTEGVKWRARGSRNA